MWNHLTLQIQTNCILFNLTGINCSHLTSFYLTVLTSEVQAVRFVRVLLLSSLTSLYFYLTSVLSSQFSAVSPLFTFTFDLTLTWLLRFNTLKQALRHFNTSQTLLQEHFSLVRQSRIVAASWPPRMPTMRVWHFLIFSLHSAWWMCVLFSDI